MNEYLYHYTSIETLLLILKNKTLAFNSLTNVDDEELIKLMVEKYCPNSKILKSSLKIK